MWKQPDYHTINAPPDIKKMLHKSIYYNSEGNLVGSSPLTILQYITVALLIWLFFSVFVFYALGSIFQNQGIRVFLQIVIYTISFVVIAGYLYQWGWNSYQEAWYHFDHKNKIFTVIQREHGSWETIEVPYEQVSDVEWSGERNGRAIIHAAGFRFYTSRALEKRFSSVTDMWSDLAQIDSRMTNWPIELHCQKCQRQFGHHIGTATCPFDQLILIDSNVKGRIDPQDQHPDDLDRV